ncbi:TPM domain-containing protein [Viscerimonas tarda]
MKYHLVLLLLFATCLLHGQNIPDPMSPPRLVNDFAGIYSDKGRNDLEQMLRNYNDTTSTQIYVVTVSNLEGYDVSDYATRLGEKWGVGQKGKDNGAVILIKPRIGNARGQVFIATGYGLEPVLTDARCGRIIDQYMLPYFMEDNYYGGTKAAIEAMIAYLSGQFEADADESSTEVWGCIEAIIFLVLLFFIFNRKGRGRGNSSSGNGRGGFFPPISMGGGGRRTGGSFGGGFSGGGGGRFGGGGAGRSW